MYLPRTLLATIVYASAVLAVRLPSTIELIYPSSGQAYTNTIVQLGLAGNTAYSGAYFYTSVEYTTPDGVTHPSISIFNTNVTSPSFNASIPQDCGMVNAGGAWANVLVNQTGTYTATWNFTYGYPTKVDTSQGNTKCTGLSSTESEVISKTFNVVANPSNTTNTMDAPTPTATGVGTFSVQPTGDINPTSTPSSSSMRASIWDKSSLWLSLSGAAGLLGLLAVS
ncbi:hypothetical protein DL93DRAFT_856271 [Clavulina sp. PMI_390]|nr:hypothetical protein DL93DRAFT_856271 [Clavulina sp. PMI_390]